MQCDYFGKCGSCTLYNMNYQQQLAFKVEKIKNIFALDKMDIITSEPEHFRTRAEFRIFHDYNTGTLSYAMHGLEKKKIIPISSCSIVSPVIAQKMPELLEAVSNNEILRTRLYAVEFLSSSTGNLLVTLIYHKKVDDAWKTEAKKMADILKIELIGRSRGIKKVVTQEYIKECLQIAEKNYHFKLYDTGFTQPNTGVNEQMISWVKEQMENSGKDLLELYCGHGNFTISLSEKFDKVLATEVSKRSILSAKENCTLNKVENIAFVRLSAEELTEAMGGKRTFKRLEGISLKEYHFSHLFVDPPRAGLDAKTLEFAQQFDNIIYISCNPETLHRDLQTLLNLYEIKSFAVFDQFAYTAHLECGVVLQKKK